MCGSGLAPIRAPTRLRGVQNRFDGMGKVTGFLEIERQDRRYAPAGDRIRHWREFVQPLSEEASRDQAARCMNCGIPYCHTGCPVNNQIPDWNDLVYRGDWQEAILNLHSTNNFPEFTGRICPAPSEAACTLNLIESPVTIKTIECMIIDRAWEKGWVKPEPPQKITGKKVAVVGSGPAGLACAQQLCRAGHEAHVYEKLAKAGGLLTYGIPDFKMEKQIVFRRIAQMEAEGVVFHYNAMWGSTVRWHALRRCYEPTHSPAAPKKVATCRSPGASSPACTSPWIFCRSRTAASAASRSATSSRSLPPASTSSSSAAATPAPTASAPPSGRARCRSPTWRSWRGRPTRRTSSSPGPTGRTSCAPRRATRRAPSATSPC